MFISLIAKTVSLNHYATIVNICTSLQWIYDKLRGIHFLNILDLNYDETTMKSTGF